MRVTAAGFMGFVSFFLLLPTIPTFIGQRAGPFGAGLATGVLMFGAIGSQIACPWLLRRLQFRILLIAGLLFLSAPAFMYARASESIIDLLTLSAVRGIGFGILTVVPVLMIASLTDGEGTGAALGWYSFYVSVAAVAGPSIGIALLSNGFNLVTMTGAVFPLIGALFVLSLDVPHGTAIPSGWKSLIGGEGKRSIARPLASWLPGAIAYGGVYSFLTIFGRASPAFALALFGSSFAIGRLFGGRINHRVQPAPLLKVGALISVCGFVALVLHSDAAEIGGLVLAGAGLGIMSITSLVETLNVAREDQYAVAAAAWAMTFDVGLAIGGLLFGAIIVAGTYENALILAALMLIVVPSLAGRIRHRDAN